MSLDNVYDKDGHRIPSREFLSMMTIMLRKCETETELPLVTWLEFIADKSQEADLHNDSSLRKIVYQILKENYLDEDVHGSSNAVIPS